MQKAIIIQASVVGSELPALDTTELNKELADGWVFVAASPFGVSQSHGGGSREKGATAAVLVILQKQK